MKATERRTWYVLGQMERSVQPLPSRLGDGSLAELTSGIGIGIGRYRREECACSSHRGATRKSRRANEVTAHTAGWRDRGRYGRSVLWSSW